MTLTITTSDPGITKKDYERSIHELNAEAGNLELTATAKTLNSLISKVQLFLRFPEEKTLYTIERFNRVSGENESFLYAGVCLLIIGTNIKMRIIGTDFDDLIKNTIAYLKRLSRRTKVLIRNLNKTFGDIQNGVIFIMKHCLGDSEISLLRETENDDNPFHFFRDEFGEFIFLKRYCINGNSNLLKSIALPSGVIKKICFYGVIKEERIIGNYLLGPSDFLSLGNA